MRESASGTYRVRCINRHLLRGRGQPIRAASGRPQNLYSLFEEIIIATDCSNLKTSHAVRRLFQDDGVSPFNEVQARQRSAISHRGKRVEQRAGWHISGNIRESTVREFLQIRWWPRP